MLNSAVLMSGMKIALTMLMIFGTGVEAAPTMRGFEKPTQPLHDVTYSSSLPEKYSALKPSQYLRNWFLSTKPAGVDGTRISDKSNSGTITAGIRSGRMKTNAHTAGPDRRTQMLRMILALEELHRTFNSALSSRITIIPRGNGRNSGRKNKVRSADEGGVKPTTSAPAAVNSTASRPSTDVIVPDLTGRHFKISLPPQSKKINKRVCFWKYCSQN